MAQIDYIIEESNTEKVRDRIAFILSVELANQKVLIEARIIVLEAITSPTPEELSELEMLRLSLLSIPEKVWLERFVRPSEGEYPVLNVILLNNPLSELTGFENQTDKARFNIEVYSMAKNEEETDGDLKASQILQRLLFICRHILMSPHVDTLNFDPGIIGSKIASDLQITQPDEGINNGYLINGQFSLMVKILETQKKLEGVELQESATTHRLYDTEKGYYYQINTN